MNKLNACYTITASSEFQEKERLYAKARHDEAQALYNAERKQVLAIAKNMVMDGEPLEKITRYTGLTYEEVTVLRNAD